MLLQFRYVITDDNMDKIAIDFFHITDQNIQNMDKILKMLPLCPMLCVQQKQVEKTTYQQRLWTFPCTLCAVFYSKLLISYEERLELLLPMFYA